MVRSSTQQCAVLLRALLVASLVCIATADCDPSVGFYGLPTIEYEGTIYLASADDPDYYCRLKGFGADAIGIPKSADLKPHDPFTGFSISTIDPETRKVCTPSDDQACAYLQVVMCSTVYTPGCGPDWKGNIGNGNDGNENVGNMNVGDFNRGNGNCGDYNVGSNNTECDPTIKWFALPTVDFQGALYLLASSGADAFCKLKGYAQSALVDTMELNASYPFPTFSISTLDPSTYRVCIPSKDPACAFVSVVECLPSGVPACQPDANGNVGNNNLGSHNHGNSNRGDDNQGSFNAGDRNIGDYNVGKEVVCFSNMPTCDPRTKFYGLPTIEYDGTLYLTSAEDPDTYCRLQGFEAAGTWAYLEMESSTTLNFPMALIDPINRVVCSPSSSVACRALSVVECLPTGISKCLMDSNGNIGNRNIGSYNIGHNNHGSNNNGNDNHGSFNTGNRNWVLPLLWALRLPQRILRRPSATATFPQAIAAATHQEAANPLSKEFIPASGQKTSNTLS
ncbi:hypothetical protein ACKKBF_B05100 [Auxenochlorella protothecoides x Auxenochlorella symbiontica]